MLFAVIKLLENAVTQVALFVEFLYALTVLKAILGGAQQPSTPTSRKLGKIMSNLANLAMNDYFRIQELEDEVKSLKAVIEDMKEYEAFKAGKELATSNLQPEIDLLTAENKRLESELELRTRERDQAIEFGDFRIVHVGAGEHQIKRPDIDNWGKEQDYPDLFPHLAGIGQ